MMETKHNKSITNGQSSITNTGIDNSKFVIHNSKVPQLRFPEFENNEEWKIEPLKKVFSIFQGYAFSSKDSIEKGTRWLKIADVSIQKMNHNNPSFLPDDYVNTYGKFLIKKGDYVLALTRPILNGKLKISVVDDLLHNSLLNQRVGKLVSNENLTLVYYLLQTNYLIEEIEKSIAGSEPPNLSMKQIENIAISLPSNPVEQQKIANCLSSLDTLITAETEKLAHLKDHKKGLLQNLFPTNSITNFQSSITNDGIDNSKFVIRNSKVPQFRFPEFVGDGDWEETTLEEVSTSIFDGTHQTPKYTDKGIPFFSVENIVSGKKNKFISNESYTLAIKKNKPEKDDILITRIGNIGYTKVIDWDFDFSIYVTLAVIKKSDSFISKYLNAYLQSSRYQKEIQSKSLLNAAPIKINMDELRKTEVLLPPSKLEQQKIANTLSSADELIQSQAEKIAALKEHKKGLMQQLFPLSEP